MGSKRPKPEEIVSKLRQVEVLQGQGMSITDAVRQIGVTQQTYYRWRKLYGGMGREQLKRLKELEKENQRLRRAVSDLTLDKLILSEAARGAEGQRSATSEPFAPPQVHRPRPAGARRIRTPRLAWVLGQHRSTQRKVPQGRSDEERLTEDIIELAREYGRYGYRMVTGLLNNAGWRVNSHPSDDAKHR